MATMMRLGPPNGASVANVTVGNSVELIKVDSGLAPPKLVAEAIRDITTNPNLKDQGDLFLALGNRTPSLLSAEVSSNSPLSPQMIGGGKDTNNNSRTV